METKFIQEWIPLFNIEENPRCQIHSIQKVIESNREWDINESKWNGKISRERINEALADYNYLTTIVNNWKDGKQSQAIIR